MCKPLKGIKVLDMTGVLAGPYSTYQLGLLGAEILKIEPFSDGDWTRKAGKSLPFLFNFINFLSNHLCNKPNNY